MDETAEVVDKVTLDSLEYLKEIDSRWKNLNTKLYEIVSHLPLLRKGKKARQTLVRLAFESVSNKDWKKDNIVPSIASALETLATSTYVIDDILDNQPERNAEDSTWKKYGLNLGILAGYLQDNISQRILRKGIEPLEDKVKIKLLDLYAETIREINEAQVLNEFMKKGTTIEQYLERTYKATGIHFENPALMSAIIGNASDKELEILRKIGKNIGIAYFVRNDLFNYIPQEVIMARNSKALKRTSYEDLKKGLWTYPIIWLMNNGSTRDKEKIQSRLGKRGLNNEELIDTTNILIESGAASATIGFIDNYRKKVREQIKKLKESRAKKLLFTYDNMFDNAKEYVAEFNAKKPK